MSPILCTFSPKSFRTFVSTSIDRLCICLFEKYRVKIMSDVKKAGHQLPVLLGRWSSSGFGWIVAIFPFLSQNGQYLISLTTSTSLSSASYLISSFFALTARIMIGLGLLD